MNLIDGIKSLFSKKTMSTDAWKRGGILADYAGINAGVTSPYS